MLRHFIENRKFTSCYKIKILNRLWEKILCHFHWTLYDRGPFCFCHHKREITHVKNQSIKCKRSILNLWLPGNGFFWNCLFRCSIVSCIVLWVETRTHWLSHCFPGKTVVKPICDTGIDVFICGNSHNLKHTSNERVIKHFKIMIRV